jgi:hypothetical protein
MALRFRTDVAVVQVRAVSVFLSFDGRGNTRAVPGRVNIKDEKLVNQENSGRVAVIAGTGADMDSPNGVIGRVRMGRAQARRIKVLVCHRVTSVSVSTSNARTSRGAWRASIRTAVIHWSPLAADQPVPRLLRTEPGRGWATHRADAKTAILTFRPL